LRYAARVDANQADIVAALRDAECSVYFIGLPVDLLVGKNGKTALVEVKTKGGRHTELQREFFATWRGGPVATVRDVDGALRLAAVLGADVTATESA